MLTRFIGRSASLRIVAVSDDAEIPSQRETLAGSDAPRPVHAASAHSAAAAVTIRTLTILTVRDPLGAHDFVGLDEPAQHVETADDPAEDGEVAVEVQLRR